MEGSRTRRLSRPSTAATQTAFVVFRDNVYFVRLSDAGMTMNKEMLRNMYAKRPIDFCKAPKGTHAAAETIGQS